MHALLDLFADVFEEPEIYSGARPSPEYLERLLARDTFIALVAEMDGHVIGGLAAYVLDKFEQARSEIYLYDLAVASTFRRRGIATALIRRTQAIAAEMDAWVVFVQADRTDDAAIALYSRLGQREDVLHFDLPVDGCSKAPSSSRNTHLPCDDDARSASSTINHAATRGTTP